MVLVASRRAFCISDIGFAALYVALCCHLAAYQHAGATNALPLEDLAANGSALLARAQNTDPHCRWPVFDRFIRSRWQPVASLFSSLSALLPTALGGSGSAWDLSFSTVLAYSTSLLVLLSLQAGVPAGPPDAFGRELKAVGIRLFASIL
jgi:hypothetical protein